MPWTFATRLSDSIESPALRLTSFRSFIVDSKMKAKSTHGISTGRCPDTEVPNDFAISRNQRESLKSDGQSTRLGQ